MEKKELFIVFVMCISILLSGLFFVAYIIQQIPILSTITISLFCLFLLSILILISLNN